MVGEGKALDAPVPPARRNVEIRTHLVWVVLFPCFSNPSDLPMTILAYSLMLLGGYIAFLNAWLLWRQLRGEHGPSIVPFVGGILLFVGGLLEPSGTLRPWAVLGLVVDYGCVPYTVCVSWYLLREKRMGAESKEPKQ